MAKRLKGKTWYTIFAPTYFEGKEIGVTPASEPELLVGRRLTIPVTELIGDMEKYYMKITFRIVRVNGDKAFTDFDGFECMRDYIARMVVRRVRRIDVIQDEVSKDGKKLRIKTIAIISRKANRSIEKRIRKRIEEMVREAVSASSMDEFIKKVISGELKKKIFEEIMKIYPPRHFEFRKIERLDLQEKLKKISPEKVEEKKEEGDEGEVKNKSGG